MNTSIGRTGGTMPRFSTDPTALSVNCFIVRRAALTSRPQADGQDAPRRASAPLEVLYPSLYAKRSTPATRWSDDILAAATAFALRILGGRSSRAVPSDEAQPASP